MKEKYFIDIMVVDDDPEILDCFRSIFKNKKVHLYLTSSSTSAVEEMKQHSYDIAYIDLYMPVMNGIETMLRLKEINPQLSAIMISGFRNPRMLQSAKNSGAQDYLFKPLQVNDILNKAIVPN